MDYFILWGILVVGFLLRNTYRDLPLDWDHGIMGYQSFWYLKTGQMPLEGEIDRKFIIRRGWLGQNLIYLLIVKLAGTNPKNIRLFHNCYYTITTIAVYLAAAQSFDPTVGLISSLLFAIFSSAPFYWAVDECPENYLILPFTLSLYFFLLWIKQDNPLFLFTSGLLGMATMLFKQNAGFYFLFYFIWILCFKFGIGNLLTLGLAFLIPYAAIFTYYLVRGVPLRCLMGTFFITLNKSGTIAYIRNLKREEKGSLTSGAKDNENVIARPVPSVARELDEAISKDEIPRYVRNDRLGVFSEETPAESDTPDNSQKTGQWVRNPDYKPFKERLLLNFLPHFKETSLLWWTTAFWVIGAVSGGHPQDIFIALVLLGVILAFLAPNKYFPYYYLPFLPIFSLCSGDFLVRLFHGLWHTERFIMLAPVNALLLAMVLGSVALFILTTYRYYFLYSPTEQAKYQYRNTLCNFLASEEIAAYIKQRTTPEDYIYVHSVNPEVYFLAERKAVIDYVYVDSLNMAYWGKDDRERFWKDFRQQLKAKKPKHIVLMHQCTLIKPFEQMAGGKYILERKFDTELGPEPDYQYWLYCRVDDERPELYNQQGEELFQLGHLEEARRLFEMALEINPYFVKAYNNLGVLYWQLNDIFLAKDFLANGLALDPDDPDLIQNYTHICHPASYQQ